MNLHIDVTRRCVVWMYLYTYISLVYVHLTILPQNLKGTRLNIHICSRAFVSVFVCSMSVCT